MIGHTISHYKILEKLGEGGMGVVYKAHDTKLDRDVALKFLPLEFTKDQDARERFIHEAKAASALDHTNICTIYEINEMDNGQLYIAMACYDGETLKKKIERGQLKIDNTIDLTIQVSRGLQKAHEKGIVHRDIKPANIIVTTEGVVKILDFGLAKLVGRTTITKTGSTMGTAAYMSPEQARGEAVDHRTDVWSLGIVMYEMLTGLRPFSSEYEQAIVYSILNEDPKPLSSIRFEIPHEFETIIQKAIAKNSEERYQQVADMEYDLKKFLKAITSPASNMRNSKTQDIPSIAVLPFKDMSSQQDQEYFCEGIAEELLNALVQIEGLRVAARTSASQFKDKAVDVRAIGKQLNVKSVLEGSVRKVGDHLRITAQLINIEDGYHLFSEKYDRTTDDIFAIQDEISLAIVDRLKVKLLSSEKCKLVKRHTENEEAYRLYLQGRYFWNRRHRGGLQRGIEFFQKAIAIDPEYALPYSGIADCYFSLGWFDFLAPKVAFEKCKEAALKALELDPDLAEAHASLGRALQFLDWDWPGAEAEFQRAIGLNPNYAEVYHFHSLLLASQGKFDEAIAESERAVKLDPIQPILRTVHAFTLWVAGRHDEAITNSRALTEFDPNFFAGWLLLGISCAEVGRLADAEDALRKADDLTGGTSTLVLGLLVYALGRAGKRNEARSILDRLLELRKSKHVSVVHIASLYWLLDNQDTAFEWLERAIEERDHWLCYAKYLPTLRLMRSDPRFTALLKKAGLEK